MYQQITDAKQLQQEFLQYEEKETTLRTQQEQLKAHIRQLEQQLARLTTDHAQAEAYRCEKIQADCPYVSVIRKVTTSALDEQRTYFTEQITTAREVTAPELIGALSVLLQKKSEIDGQITEKKQLFIAL
jgi:chromosome segregation ATPase